MKMFPARVDGGDAPFSQAPGIRKVAAISFLFSSQRNITAT
jgi:hypothetical protein